MKKLLISCFNCPILSKFLTLEKICIQPQWTLQHQPHEISAFLKFTISSYITLHTTPLFSSLSFFCLCLSQYSPSKKLIHFPELTIETSSTALLQLLVVHLSYTLAPSDSWFTPAPSKMYMSLFVAPSLDWHSKCYIQYGKIPKLSPNHSIVKPFEERDDYYLKADKSTERQAQLPCLLGCFVLGS